MCMPNLITCVKLSIIGIFKVVLFIWFSFKISDNVFKSVKPDAADMYWLICTVPLHPASRIQVEHAQNKKRKAQDVL